MYQAATFNSAVSSALGILAETIRDPTITEEEVRQQLETADYEIGEIWSKARPHPSRTRARRGV